MAFKERIVIMSLFERLSTTERERLLEESLLKAHTEAFEREKQGLPQAGQFSRRELYDHWKGLKSFGSPKLEKKREKAMEVAYSILQGQEQAEAPTPAPSTTQKEQPYDVDGFAARK